MRKIILTMLVVIVASLGSPFATSALAKEKPAKADKEATVCVCPPDCTHETVTMDKDCLKHKCCKKHHGKTGEV